MNRVILIHWNAAEMQERAARLRRAGYRVDTYAKQGGLGLRTIGKNPPDAFVIDLTRLPSHGRAVGSFLRQQKGTRFIPIVFVEGDPEKVARVRKELPDAVYTQWNRIRSAIKQAIKNPPKDPVVRDGITGYSGTPLPRKLGIKPGSVVALLGAPAGFQRTLGTLPKDVQLRKQARAGADLIILFAKSRADLDRRLPPAMRALRDRAGLWIAWPKKTSQLAGDLTQTVVRATGLDAGLVDYRICAIDDTWSALLFTRRRPQGKSKSE
jgi:CheY-like chemotaxis protein